MLPPELPGCGSSLNVRVFSIRTKLLLIIMASSATALLCFAVAFLIYQDHAFRETLVQDLSAEAQGISRRSTAALVFDDTNAVAEYLSVLADKPNIVAACFYLGTNRFAPPYLRDPQAAETVPAHPEPMGWTFSREALAGFEPILSDGQPLGWVYLKSDLRDLRRQLWKAGGYLSGLGLGALLVAWLLAAWLQRLITRPIFQLAETARAVTTQKNYSLRARKESADELGRLVDGFNEMLEQIQQRDEALRRVNDELEARVQERARDLQQQLNRIGLLNQITYAMAERKDFQSILQVVLEQLEEYLPLDYGAAYLLDAAGGVLKLVHRGPQSRKVAAALGVPDVVPISQTAFGSCLNGELVYYPDSRRLSAPVTAKFQAAGFHSSVGAPLAVEGKVIGLMVLMRRTENGFSPRELEFIRGLSAHVALAIHQVQLHQDLRKAYEELRRTQQTVMQQERLKALGQMASGIAHDINNALSPVIGFADLIAQGEPHLSDDTRRHLRYIKTAGEDIAHIVERLREFYRPRDRDESLAMINLNVLVEQAVAMTRPRWRDIPQSRGVMIEIRTELDPALPELAGIETEIRESLTNLILNSVDAMPAGGVITLRTRTVETALKGREKTSPHVVLEVSDTGVGMDEETRRRCLEPFFSTKGRRGTGLGLAMVYGVMERHEGQIEVDSEPGRGTTVRLIFPITVLAAAAQGADPEEQPPGPLRILCVDDEPLVRELVKELLERDGHTVDLADGGAAGIEAFRTACDRGQPFHVVITDLGMPYVDGREVVAAVKRQSPRTPVILLTGWGAFLKEEGAASIPSDGVLSKPPHFQEIRALLRKVVKP